MNKLKLADEARKTARDVVADLRKKHRPEDLEGFLPMQLCLLAVMRQARGKRFLRPLPRSGISSLMRGNLYLWLELELLHEGLEFIEQECLSYWRDPTRNREAGRDGDENEEPLRELYGIYSVPTVRRDLLTCREGGLSPVTEGDAGYRRLCELADEFEAGVSGGRESQIKKLDKPYLHMMGESSFPYVKTFIDDFGNPCNFPCVPCYAFGKKYKISYLEFYALAYEITERGLPRLAIWKNKEWGEITLDDFLNLPKRYHAAVNFLLEEAHGWAKRVLDREGPEWDGEVRVVLFEDIPRRPAWEEWSDIEEHLESYFVQVVEGGEELPHPDIPALIIEKVDPDIEWFGNFCERVRALYRKPFAEKIIRVVSHLLFEAEDFFPSGRARREKIAEKMGLTPKDVQRVIKELVRLLEFKRVVRGEREYWQLGRGVMAG